MSSEIAFCAPYDVRGIVGKSSPILSGKGGPNTAMEDVKMIFGR